MIEWETVKKDKYDDIKKEELKDIQNLEGYFNYEKIEENSDNFLKIRDNKSLELFLLKKLMRL